MTVYAQAFVNNGVGGTPGAISAPGRSGNGGAGAPGGTGSGGGGHGEGGAGSGGNATAGTDGANGTAGKAGTPGNPGNDGQLGTPGTAGQSGTPGTITGASFTPPFGPAQLAAGHFQIQINGPPGAPYVIQGSTNLLNWTSLSTNLAPFTFSDPATKPFRFYRISH